MLGLMPESIKQMGFPSMVCNPLEQFARLSQCPTWLGETRVQGMLSTKPMKALSQHLVSIYNFTPI